MKKILTALLSALLLAAPAAVAARPDALSLQDRKSTKKTVTVTFNVNMHCENCVEKLTDRLSFLKGVEDLHISLDQKTVMITYNPDKTDEATLAKAIEKCGYSAEKVAASIASQPASRS